MDIKCCFANGEEIILGVFYRKFRSRDLKEKVEMLLKFFVTYTKYFSLFHNMLQYKKQLPQTKFKIKKI